MWLTRKRARGAARGAHMNEMVPTNDAKAVSPSAKRYLGMPAVLPVTRQIWSTEKSPPSSDVHRYRKRQRERAKYCSYAHRPAAPSSDATVPSMPNSKLVKLSARYRKFDQPGFETKHRLKNCAISSEGERRAPRRGELSSREKSRARKLRPRDPR